MAPSHVIVDVSIATMVDGQADYGIIRKGAFGIGGELILWAGEASQCPGEFPELERRRYGGRLVTPALLDCHSHIVHGGNRAWASKMRLKGAGYEEIAKAGSGIWFTVAATSQAGFEELLNSALRRVDALIGEGASTIEIKSGYGLNEEAELKMLRVARKIATLRPGEIVTTYMGARAIPADIDADEYIET